MRARYLNVDCLLRSDHRLDDLLAALGDEVFLLWNEESGTDFSLGIETKLTNTESPEQDIAEFLRLIQLLPPTLLQQVKDCTEKLFEIGFEVEEGEEVLETRLTDSTMRHIHELGFMVGIRIYPS